MCNFVTSVFFWRRSLHESAFASWFVFFIVVSRSGLIYNSCFSSTDFFFIHSVKLFSRVSHIEWESTKKKVETWKKKLRENTLLSLLLLPYMACDLRGRGSRPASSSTHERAILWRSTYVVCYSVKNLELTAVVGI